MGTASSDCLSRQFRVLHPHSLNPSGCTQKNEEPETVAQLSFLRERKCSMIQGYLLSRPVPLAAFVAQLGRLRKIVVALASPIG
jgi:hypothetical protein